MKKASEKLKNKLRKPFKLPVGACTKCGAEGVKLHAWDEPPALLCDGCDDAFLTEGLKAARAATEAVRARKAQEAALLAADEEKKAQEARERKARTDAETARKVHQVKRAVRLSAEGNLQLMKRLLLQGKSDATILEHFTTLYAAEGKTDPKWINARVRTYKKIAKEGK